MTSSRIGQTLLRDGALDVADLERALALQGQLGGRLGTNLLELGLVSERRLLDALGRVRSLPTVRGSELAAVPGEVVRLVPEKLARRHRLVPFALRGRTLYVAAADPIEARHEDEIRFATSCLVRCFLGLEARIHEALERYYRISGLARAVAVGRRLAAGRRNGDGTTPPAAEDEVAAGDGALPAQPLPISAPAPPESPSAASAEASALAPPSSPPPEPSPGAAEPIPEAAAEAPAPARSPSGEMRYVELDEEDRALLTRRRPEVERAPGERLAEAARTLGEADRREEIAAVLLSFSRPYFVRRLLLRRQGERIIGWRGAGEGVLAEEVSRIAIPAADASVLQPLKPGGYWRGPLPALPQNRPLLEALGGQAPSECLVVPIAVRGKPVAFVYGDNRDSRVTSAPLDELRLLAEKAGIAFEVCVLRNKIRTL